DQRVRVIEQRGAQSARIRVSARDKASTSLGKAVGSADRESGNHLPLVGKSFVNLDLNALVIGFEAGGIRQLESIMSERIGILVEYSDLSTVIWSSQDSIRTWISDLNGCIGAKRDACVDVVLQIFVLPIDEGDSQQRVLQNLRVDTGRKLIGLWPF